jgi:ABC-type sugar transport system ATPase subunit
VLIHSAAVITPNGALLVLGHSGAGKSTFCRLVADHYPTLADDVCSLGFCKDSGWVVTDVKKVGDDQPAPVRLYGIMRVYQSRSSRLVNISDREACRYLMDAMFEVETQRSASLVRKREWFAQAAFISRKYSGWKLMFPLDSQVVRLIEDRFGSIMIRPYSLPG